MKKLLIFLIIIFGLFVSANAFAAEKINSFDAVIKIREDAAIEVSERIEYDFGSAQKHGIFRDIPIKYQARGGNFALRISDISVTDGNGAPYQFTTSYPGNNIKIKIGDPNVEITSRHIYTINYTIKRAINYFDNHDELYWNITGNDWLVAIDSASAKIIIPQKIASEDIQADCFAGPFGSTEKCNSILKGLGQTDSASFNENQLAINNGLTIVVGFRKGIVIKPSNFEVALETAKDNWIIGLPILTLIICLYLWYTRGRDPNGRGIIIAQYEPPDNLTPSEVGIIIDTQVQNKDITAEIIYLAEQGYLKIKQCENQRLVSGAKDFEFEIINNDFSRLNKIQRFVIYGFYKRAIDRKIKLSDLKNVIYKDLTEAKTVLYQSMVERGYFNDNPSKIRNTYIGAGILVVGPAFFISLVFGYFNLIIGIITGFIIIIFGYMMPCRTKKGVEAKEHILGLKSYMSVAEQRRIEFHSAPEKNPEIFEKLLPYAMVLGIEKQWAQQFEEIYTHEPSWYHGSNGPQFSAISFTDYLDSFSQVPSAASALESFSATGGGSGFSGGGSGGGGGGGGGGSW